MNKELKLKLNNNELRILWSALNFAQGNGIMGLERFKDISEKFIEWELETINELTVLQSIKTKIKQELEK